VNITATIYRHIMAGTNVNASFEPIDSKTSGKLAQPVMQSVFIFGV
jgi:hypothetical protein